MTNKEFQNSKHFSCVMGSHAYACNLPGSDIDIRGFYVPKLVDALNPIADSKGKAIRSVHSWQEDTGAILRTEMSGYDVCLHHIKRMFALWAKGSPEYFELLLNLDSRVNLSTKSPISQSILSHIWDNRSAFYSIKVKSAYRGFIEQVLKDLEHARNNFDEAKALKWMSTAIRLSGNLLQFLNYQAIDLEAYGTMCYDLRVGNMSKQVAMDTIYANLGSIKKAADKAVKSWLPTEPDADRIKHLYMEVILDKY